MYGRPYFRRNNNQAAMGKFRRFVMYKVDCAFMLAVIGLQFFLFRGEMPFDYHPEEWLKTLLQSSGHLWLTTVVGGALYWTVVDFHPGLVELRGSRVVSKVDGQQPDTGTRFLRSLIKSFSLFGGRWLLLFCLIDKQHRFVHDAVTDTERVKL